MNPVIQKLDFNKFFDLQLARYGNSIREATSTIPNDFDKMIASKEIFRDNLFQWFIKMINVIDKFKPLEPKKPRCGVPNEIGYCMNPATDGCAYCLEHADYKLGD